MTSSTAAAVEARLQALGIQLTLGGEPTYVPFEPEGAEWTVAADGPTKLRLARALAAELQRRRWPDATLLYCVGKQYAGETNPRWALRLIHGTTSEPLVTWPQRDGRPRPLPPSDAGASLMQRIGEALGCPLAPIPLEDPLQSDRQVWAALLHHDDWRWKSSPWPLAEPQRQLLRAPGPAGLRLPLEQVPDGVPRQVLTLEISPSQWGLFLPPVARQPLEQLLAAIAASTEAWAEPELSGMLPLDTTGHWQVLGLTADPGVLEVNLPVCSTWQEYADWLELLEVAGAAVGLRSWKWEGERQVGTGGGNHLLWGGPSLEAEQHPFFSRPAWLVGVLRYWQRHPALAYLFSGNSVGPASQAPRPDEGSATWLDLQLAHRLLAELGPGDQRVAISETLRHLHADRSGNTHRSEISLDKFWNPAWTAGCQGLIEFRAIETMPDHTWSSAVALLWRALAVHLLTPEHRPQQLHPWGEGLHDRALLPSQLWRDLEAVLADLAADGLPLDAAVFRRIWEWRFPTLLQWGDANSGAELELRQALEPWPLLCDTPVEGGLTSRFVDSSLRRFEVSANAAFRQHHCLLLNGHPLPIGGEAPLAVRYRHDALYPCLHPCLAPHLPLLLQLHRADGPWLAGWQLGLGDSAFQPLSGAPAAAMQTQAAPWRGAAAEACTVDLRLPETGEPPVSQSEQHPH